MKKKPFRYNLIIPRTLYREIKRAAKALDTTTPKLVRKFIRAGLDDAKTEHTDAGEVASE